MSGEPERPHFQVNAPMSPHIRKASPDEVSALTALIKESARTLGSNDYSSVQIEAALGTAWGVDTQLISDGTYFVVEIDSTIAACGGWSARKTLFGADGHSGRESELLQPGRDAARIRAFFVHPDWARKGLAKLLLQHCENEARMAGFTSAELMATFPGQRFYRSFGYIGEDRVEHLLRDGIRIEFIPMRKEFL
jgi:GNAT superfamily N-acetyltransferase